MAQERLDHDVKVYVVQRLACYETPKQVVEGVKEEFDVDMSTQHTYKYDPTRVSGQSMGEELKELFYKTRKEFNENVSLIPIAQKAYRVQCLLEMQTKTMAKGNYALASSLLEQAAKEMGEAYTNRQKVDHVSSDGSMTPREAVQLTDEQLLRIASGLEG